jgi:hypothetical protein
MISHVLSQNTPSDIYIYYPKTIYRGGIGLIPNIQLDVEETKNDYSRNDIPTYINKSDSIISMQRRSLALQRRSVIPAPNSRLELFCVRDFEGWGSNP